MRGGGGLRGLGFRTQADEPTSSTARSVLRWTKPEGVGMNADCVVVMVGLQRGGKLRRVGLLTVLTVLS